MKTLMRYLRFKIPFAGLIGMIEYDIPIHQRKPLTIRIVIRTAVSFKPPLIHEWAMNILQMGFGRVALPDRLDVEIDHDIPFLRKIEDFSSRRFVRP